MKKLPLLRELKGLKGKRIILRLDLNVPIKDGLVSDDFRIKKIIPTLEYLSSGGAKVVVMAHLAEKEGGTLEPVARYLSTHFPRLRFIKDIYSPEAKRESENLSDGGIILFENLRKWKGEKDNDPFFAKHLSSFGDIYVNEAFSASHREHSSIVGIPKILPSFIGLLFEEEMVNLSQTFNPTHPFLFILGGAKFETKIPLMKKMLPSADDVFVGGAIANDFFKAKGYFLGDSLLSKEEFDLGNFLSEEKIILPQDVRTNHKGFKYLKKPNEISVGEKISDVGSASIKSLEKKIEEASLIVWNGPMGNIEMGAVDGTLELARDISSSKAKTIVGGGDTISVLQKTDFFSKFSFVSTGGGAMLDFLASETLPGIDAIAEEIKIEKKSWVKNIFS